MNLIGLDISKVSTAMVIETGGKTKIFSYNTNDKKYKWNKLSENIAQIRTYEYDNKEEIYSKKEINKLKTYINISNDLLMDLKNNINEAEETIIYVEGYSYGKDSSQIVELVSIGTLIRSKILENVKNIKQIEIVAPKSLKLKSAEMIYGFTETNIGKRKEKIVKIINTNKEGKKGGDFDKKDMLNAIIDYNESNILSNFLNQNYDDIIKVKNVPKPIEDINDAWLLKEIIKYA